MSANPINMRGYIGSNKVQVWYGHGQPTNVWYEVEFLPNGSVKVSTYTPYGWSSSQMVGDYDDWQIGEIVDAASRITGVKVEGWYTEPSDLSKS